MRQEAGTEPKNTEQHVFEQGLTRKQVEAIPHLVGARSFEEGCRKARIGKTTLYQWLKDDAFRSELERHREEVVKEALERLKTSVTRAVDGLIALSEDKEKGVRLRAIEKILDLFFKTREQEEIEGRLEKIERIILERRSYK